MSRITIFNLFQPVAPLALFVPQIFVQTYPLSSSPPVSPSPSKERGEVMGEGLRPLKLPSIIIYVINTP